MPCLTYFNCYEDPLLCYFATKSFSERLPSRECNYSPINFPRCNGYCCPTDSCLSFWAFVWSKEVVWIITFLRESYLFSWSLFKFYDFLFVTVGRILSDKFALSFLDLLSIVALKVLSFPYVAGFICIKLFYARRIVGKFWLRWLLSRVRFLMNFGVVDTTLPYFDSIGFFSVKEFEYYDCLSNCMPLLALLFLTKFCLFLLPLLIDDCLSTLALLLW